MDQISIPHRPLIRIGPKILAPPSLGQKIIFLKCRLYCIQNDRLCNAVPTKQSVNSSEYVRPRYPPRHAKYWRFGLVRLFDTRLGGYLSPRYSDKFSWDRVIWSILLHCFICFDSWEKRSSARTFWRYGRRGRRWYFSLSIFAEKRYEFI